MELYIIQILAQTVEARWYLTSDNLLSRV